MLVAYPASLGPAVYLRVRGWLPAGMFLTYSAPMSLVSLPEAADDAFGYYLTWCRDEAWQDMGRPTDPKNRR